MLKRLTNLSKITKSDFFVVKLILKSICKLLQHFMYNKLCTQSLPKSLWFTQRFISHSLYILTTLVAVLQHVSVHSTWNLPFSWHRDDRFYRAIECLLKLLLRHTFFHILLPFTLHCHILCNLYGKTWLSGVEVYGLVKSSLADK